MITAAQSTSPSGARAAEHVPRARPAAGPMDVSTLMLVAELDQRDAQEVAATGQITAKKNEREAKLHEVREAQAQAKEAQERAGHWANLAGVASTVATVAACVAAVASIAVTGGASTPLMIAAAGTLLSASSPAVTNLAGEDAGKVAFWGGVAASVVGGGISIAATRAATAKASTEAAKTLATWAQRTVVAAHVAEGGGRIVQGGATVAQKRAEGEAVDDQADLVAHRATVKRVQSEIDEVVAGVADLEASVRRAISTVIQTQQREIDTERVVVSHIGRSVGA